MPRSSGPHSTPLDEARHNASKPSRRYLADLLRYNEASVELAHAFGFAVNDLYQVANAAVQASSCCLTASTSTRKDSVVGGPSPKPSAPISSCDHLDALGQVSVR